MNKLFPVSALLLAAGLIAGCEQPSQSVGPVIRPNPAHGNGGSGSTSVAHPALTYIQGTYQTQHGTTHYKNAVWVADSDGANATGIYTPSNYVDYGTTREAIYEPCWSPSGTSVLFADDISTNSGSTWTRYLKACDVSVNSQGQAVASNFRTLYTSTSTTTLRSFSWCSSSSTGKIALVTSTGTGVATTFYLQTMPQSGGTPSTLLSMLASDSSISSGVTWSPDDSKLAFGVRLPVDSSSGTPIFPRKLLVVSAADGSSLEEYDLTSIGGPSTPEWSRTGNTIAFATSGNTNYIYYIDYGSGGAAYTQYAVGTDPTWSPNDASLLAYNYTVGGFVKLDAFGSTETTQTWSLTGSLNNPGDSHVGGYGRIKWRR